VPLTTIEQAALDYLDEQTRRPGPAPGHGSASRRHPVINNYTILHSPHGLRGRRAAAPEAPHAPLVAEVPDGVAAQREFPTHLGYKPAQDTPILVEAEA